VNATTNLTGRQQTKNALVTLGITLAGYAVRFGVNLFLARTFSPELYGNYSLAVKLLLLISTISLLGTNNSIFRFFSLYLRANDKTKAFTFLQWNLHFISRAFVSCVILSVLLFSTLISLHLLGIKSIQTYHVVVYMLLITPVAGMATLFYSYLIGVQYNRIATLLRNLMAYIIEFCAFMGALYLLNMTANNVMIAGVLCTSFAILVILFICLLRANLGKNFTRSLLNFWHKPQQPDPSWQKTSLNLAFSNIMFLITATTDLVIIDILISNKTMVGYYAAALTISMLLFYLPGSIFQTVRPLISSLIKTPEGKQQLVKKLRNANYLLFSLLIPLATGMIIFGKSLLIYFGPAYIVAYPALVLCVITMVVICSAFASIVLLTNAGNVRHLLYINLTEVLLLISSGLLLTWRFGIVGMAAASLLAALVKAGLYLYLSQKTLGIKSLGII
jgi:O-antigen/teichoic acid export membrane protein